MDQLFPSMGDLILPHYKNNNSYHNRKLQYEIPKDQQILFPIDTGVHYKDEQTLNEANYANLMRISKKLPHIKMFEPNFENNKSKIPFDYKSSNTNIKGIDLKNQKEVIKRTIESDDYLEKKNISSGLKIPYKKLNLKEQEDLIEEYERKRNQTMIKNHVEYRNNQDLRQVEEEKDIFIPKKEKKKSLLKRKSSRNNFSFSKIWESIKSFEFISFLIQFIKNLFGLNPYQQKSGRSFSRGRYMNGV